MNVSTPGRQRPAWLLLALGLLVAVILAIAAGSGAFAGSPEPTDSPPPSPTATPAPSPTRDPFDYTRVELDTVDDHDVHVDIYDRAGTVVGARSGTPGDGASVDFDVVEVENVDETTLRLTWADYPIDNPHQLYVYAVDGTYTLLLIRPEPTGDTDSIAFDRVLLVEFGEPVSADEIEAHVQDGVDSLS